MNINKAVSLPKELWEKIDKKRGDISRSKFINNILIEHFEYLKGGQK